MENLVVSIFKTESEAYQVFAELKTFKQTEKTKVAQIAVIKNEDGHITDKDRFDFEDSANDGALKGGLIGAFVGLLAGPLGVLFGYGIGSLYGLAGGDTVEAVQEGLIDQVSQKLVSGETALVALVQEDDEQVLNAYFNKYDTQILRWNVESVVEEIEAAAKVQADLYNKARAQMKAERKEARKEKIENRQAQTYSGKKYYGNAPKGRVASVPDWAMKPNETKESPLDDENLQLLKAQLSQLKTSGNSEQVKGE